MKVDAWRGSLFFFSIFFISPGVWEKIVVNVFFFGLRFGLSALLATWPLKSLRMLGIY